MKQGDFYFEIGSYLKASEHYRRALLENPLDMKRNLAFATALFALGNYHRASSSLRRARVFHKPPHSFKYGIAEKFPFNNMSYALAREELKQYVTYNQRAAAALTVLAYVAYDNAERNLARSACNKLLSLDSCDCFAEFLLQQMESSSFGR